MFGFFKKLLTKERTITVKEKIVYKLVGLDANKISSSFYNAKMSAKKAIKQAPRGYIYAGEFKPKDIKNAVITVMNSYVGNINRLIEELGDHINEEEKQEILKEKQFITFDEFKTAFDKPEKLEGVKTRHQYSVKEGREIPKETYYKYDKKDLSFPFKYFKDRNDFVRNYKKNEDGYLKLLKDSKLEIASFFESSIPYFIADNERKKHTFIMAGSGAGKSEYIKILIYSTIVKNKDKGIVLIEPHGDLALQVAQLEYFRSNPERLVYIDFNIDSKYTPIINPFYLKEKSDKNIQTLTGALIKTFASLLKNEFSQRMETMLKYCLPVLIRRENSTLFDLKRFVSIGDKANNQDLIELGMKSPYDTHKDYFNNDFIDNKTLKVTKDGLRDRISSILACPVFAKAVTGKQSIDLEKLLKEGKVIVFNLSKGVLGEDSGQDFGSLIVGILLYVAYKREEVLEYLRPESHLFIDEFQNYVTNDPKQFEKILSETRKYGLSLTIANQYARQLGGLGLKEAIEENTRVEVRGFSKKDDELKKLEPGYFYITTGGQDPVKTYAPDILSGNKQSITAHEWEYVKKNQLKKYYQYSGLENQKPDVKEKTNKKEIPKDRKGSDQLKGFKPNLDEDMEF